MVSRLVGTRLVLPSEKMMVLGRKLYGRLIETGNALRSQLLLLIRLYWGWEFFLTGKGKLTDLEKPAQYFAGLGLPFPHVQAILAGCMECLGGLLLLIDLASRLVSLPLMILLTVAYCTADLDALRAIFSDPDKFTGAAEFLFLLAVGIVFVCGPGAFSIDALLAKYFRRNDR